MKRIVVYYSFEGNTKEAAERIARNLKADIKRAIPVKDIPMEAPAKFITGGFMALTGRKAPIVPIDADLASYDEIIIGSPVWAGHCVPYINTVLKDEDVRKKVVGLFVLSGSGSADKCIESLKKKLPNLKHVVSLSDRVGKGAAMNKKKEDGLCEEILAE